jgi:hypothetical protein
MMRFRYSNIDRPPCLMVPVVVAGIGGALVQDCDAKIDTGADATVIPTMIARALGLVPCGHATICGVRSERWTSVPIYQVRLRVAGSDWIETIAVDAPKEYLSLGRDVLNRFLLTANGPAGWFELDMPTAP